MRIAIVESPGITTTFEMSGEKRGQRKGVPGTYNLTRYANPYPLLWRQLSSAFFPQM